MTQDPADQILQWVHPYPLPPAGFDARSATNQRLAEFGLPERPDPRTEPEHLAFWELMLDSSTEVMLPEFRSERILSARTRESHRHGPGVGRGFDHRANSRNWSGAYIMPILRPNRFLHVMGSWIVPDPAVPLVPPSADDPQNQDYRSSTWIGLGGERPYNSLPQIGTSQHVTVTNGVPTVEMGAWWQWWVKGRPQHHVPFPILNFDVKAGDRISASLTVEAPQPGDVRFNLKNHRTRKLVAFKVIAPPDILPVGATAEWVHERPTRLNSREMYPMPACSEVVFQHCFARSAPDFGAPATLQKLDNNARLIRMCQVFDNPHRSVLVSRPERTSATSLRIAYHEAGA